MPARTVLDLFAGAGGLSTGLKDAGFHTVYANEHWKPAADTFALNHPGVDVDNRDIREVDAALVRRRLGLAKGELDLIAGGPPCQGFSINAPTRSTDDSRNHLFREYLRFVEEFQPKAVLIENVPGLVSFEKGATLQAILDALHALDYSADVRILYAPHYGVPQTRFRTIILAIRGIGHDATALFPEPQRTAPMRVNFTATFAGRDLVTTPSPDLPRHTTVADAFSDLPALANGEMGETVKAYASEPRSDYQRQLRAGSPGVTHHEAGRLTATNLTRFEHIPPGGNWTNIPEGLLPAGMRSALRTDHTKRYGRVHPDGLASTILTKCDPHWGAYLHYDQDRAFTVREAARIQSFPDTYTFTGSRSDQYKQVGNAVPPLLALAIGTTIARALDTQNDITGLAA